MKSCTLLLELSTHYIRVFEDMSLEGFKSLTASMASLSTGWVYDRKLYTQSRNTVGYASEIVDPK